MADDNAPMDFEQRTDAAMEAFTADESTTETAVQDPPAEEQRTDGTEGQPDAQDPNAREHEQQDATPQLTDEQRLADPQYQQLSAFKDEIDNAFAEFGIPDAKEAKLQLSDAQVLYQIAQGQAPPSQLLDMFAQNWKPEQVKTVADNLIGWLTKGGFLKDGQAGPAPKAGEAGFKDPLADRLDKIENEGKTRQQQEAAKAEQVRKDKVFSEVFMPAVVDVCAQKGIPKEDHNSYIDAIASKINGNPAILKRIEAKNFVDVKRFLAEVHNAEVARLTRYNKAQMAKQEVKGNNPRIPSGGAPPAPAGSAKKAPRDRDSRIAAGLEML